MVDLHRGWRCPLAGSTARPGDGLSRGRRVGGVWQVAGVGPAVPVHSGPADRLGVGDGDREAGYAGGVLTCMVVMAEVSGYLVDGQPDGRDGGVQGVGEGL